MSIAARGRRTAAIEEYVAVMTEVVTEARGLAAAGGYAVTDVPDEDLLHGLLRLREAVEAARRRPVRVRARVAG